MNSLNLICYLKSKGIELTNAECSMINIAFREKQWDLICQIIKKYNDRL